MVVLGKDCMLVHLGMLVVELVLVVQINERAVPSKVYGLS